MSSHSNSPNDDFITDAEYSAYSSGSELDLDVLARGLPGTSTRLRRNDLSASKKESPLSLLHITAKYIANSFPFEVVELSPVTVPEELQNLIAFYSFPTDEADIWLYSCLSGGGSYSFSEGELLWAKNAVVDCIQIGFHLSANVAADPSQTDRTMHQHHRQLTNNALNFMLSATQQQPPPMQQQETPEMNVFDSSTKSVYRVSLTFDRQKITNCTCTCTSNMDVDTTAAFIPIPICQALSVSDSQIIKQPRTEMPPRMLRGMPDSTMMKWTSWKMQQPDQNIYTQQKAQQPKPSPMGIWCAHVVAACLSRIRSPDSVLLRAPLSESLAKLSKIELQKFAQNLICVAGAEKILPAAQRILDQLLTSSNTPIKSCAGAPDPTAGGAIGDVASWCFDGAVLENKLRTALRRFCAPKSVFYSDLGSLYSNVPSGVEEFNCLRLSLRSSNEPRGVWDLLSVISDMLRRDDKNGVILLELLTRCMLEVEELMAWWYIVQLNIPLPSKPSQLAKQKQSYYSATWLCEEVVELWRLACLDPELRPPSTQSTSFFSPHLTGSGVGYHEDGLWLRGQLACRLVTFHQLALERSQAGLKRMLNQRSISLAASANNNIGGNSFNSTNSPQIPGTPVDLINTVFAPSSRSLFIGFKPALAACRITWPLEQPSTQLLSKSEFSKLLPSFNGAFVDNIVYHPEAVKETPRAECLDQVATFMVAEQLESYSALSSEGFPVANDKFEMNFARCQAQSAHGLTNQALFWARHLALQTLCNASSLLEEARHATEEGLQLINQIAVLKAAFANSPPMRSDNSNPVEGMAMSNATPRGSNGRKHRRTNLGAAPSGATSNRGSRRVPGGIRKALGPTSNASSLISSSQGFAELDEVQRCQLELAKSTASVFTVKMRYWLSRIQFLMDCLYFRTESEASLIQQPNLASRRLIKVFADRGSSSDTGDGVGLLTESNSQISDPWTTIDVELSFRLGLLFLALPRPPASTGPAEVRLHDQEVAILYRLYRLPLDAACPWVLDSVREEAARLLIGGSNEEDVSNVCIPYSLVTFLFQLLVGSSPRYNDRTTVGTATMSSSVNGVDDVDVDADEEEATDGASLSNLSGGLMGGPAGSNPVSTPALMDSPSQSIALGALPTTLGLPLALRIQRRGCKSIARPTDASIRNDAELGFRAALSVLKMRSRIPESSLQHEMFIEGQRTQMHSLALQLLRFYKEEPRKLTSILEAILDRDFNPHFKPPSLILCLSGSYNTLMNFRFDAINGASAGSGESGGETDSEGEAELSSQLGFANQSSIVEDVARKAGVFTDLIQPLSDLPAVCELSVMASSPPLQSASNTTGHQSTTASELTPVFVANEPFLMEDEEKTEVSVTTDYLHLLTISDSIHPRGDRHMDEAASTSEDTDTLSDSKAWAERFRCIPLPDPRKLNRHSVGMAAIDSSAPETTSSDNSPAASRRFLFAAATVSASGDGAVPTNDAVSSTTTTAAARIELPLRTASSFSNSSPDCSSSDQGRPSSAARARDESHMFSFFNDKAAVNVAGSSGDFDVNVASSSIASEVAVAVSNNQSLTGTVNSSSSAVKCPSKPLSAAKQPASTQNPTELMAFHMFQLAKTVRQIAGGPSASGSVFIADAEARGAPHKNLQFAAFLVGFYALGLYNRLHTSWQSRTYSRHVTWISRQVCEIGLPAAFAIYHSWRFHLNAAELAAIASQLSTERDRTLINVAAELCLASLTDCATLKPHEILRALDQCRDHSPKTLERGLLCIEKGADAIPSGILPEIHFHLARRWFDLYQLTFQQHQAALLTLGLQRTKQASNQQPLDNSANPTMVPFVTQASISQPLVETPLSPAVWQQQHPSVYPTFFPTTGNYPPVGNQQSQQSTDYSFNPVDLSPATYATPLSQQAFNPQQACYPQLSQMPFISEATGDGCLTNYPQLQATFPSSTIPVCQPNQLLPPQPQYQYPSQQTQLGVPSTPPQFYSQLTNVTGLASGLPTSVSFLPMVQVYQQSVSADTTPFLTANLGALSSTSSEVSAPSAITAASTIFTTANDDSASTTFSMLNNPSTSVVAGSEEGEELSSSHSDSRGGVALAAIKKGNEVTPQTVSALSSKSHVFLRRAFQAAMCSIEKLFPSQTIPLGSTSPHGSGFDSNRTSHRSRFTHSASLQMSLSEAASTASGNMLADGGVWGEQDRSSFVPSSSSAFPDLFNKFGFMRDASIGANNFDANILWTLEVADKLGPNAVHEYCYLVLQCIQCPLLMKAVTNKVCQYYQDNLPALPQWLDQPPLQQPQTMYDPSQYPPPLYQSLSWNPFLRHHQQLHQVRRNARWTPINGVVQQQRGFWQPPQTQYPSAAAAQMAEFTSTPQAVQPQQQNNHHHHHQGSQSPPGKELVQRMINRTHSLFHKFINQRLRHIGQGKVEWDDLVEILLNVYQLHARLPASDRELQWDALLTRISRHPKCSPALWQRIVAGIQTADLKPV